jgi:hypothetical protein
VQVRGLIARSGQAFLIFKAAPGQQNQAALTGHRCQGMAWIGIAPACRAAVRWLTRGLCCRRPDGAALAAGSRLCMRTESPTSRPRPDAAARWRADRIGGSPGGTQLPQEPRPCPEGLADAGALVQRWMVQVVSQPMSQAERGPQDMVIPYGTGRSTSPQDPPAGTPTVFEQGPSSKRRYRSTATCVTCIRGSVRMLAHADVSEFRYRILMQRPAFPSVISNALRGTWLGAGTPPSGGPDRCSYASSRAWSVIFWPHFGSWEECFEPVAGLRARQGRSTWVRESSY